MTSRYHEMKYFKVTASREIRCDNMAATAISEINSGYQEKNITF